MSDYGRLVEAARDDYRIFSGTITGPAAFVDLTLPTGFLRFTLELIELDLSAKDGIALVLSNNGVTYIGDAVNSDSYLGVCTNLRLAGGPPNFNTATASDVKATDGVIGLNTDQGVASSLRSTHTYRIYPGSAGSLAQVVAETTGFDITAAPPQLIQTTGWMMLNPAAVVVPTKQRIKSVRFGPYGNGDLGAPTSATRLTAGSYILSGIPA